MLVSQQSTSNVTVTMPPEVSDWVRVHAAQNRTSVSRFLGSLLEERMRQELGYEAAMEAFFSEESRPLKTAGKPLPKRDSLYERG